MPRLLHKSALSTNDIIMIPQYSNIESRLKVDITTQLTKGIKVGHPIVSTNMSTVSDVAMIKTMHSTGGCGSLHRFLKESEVISKLKSLKLVNVYPIICSVGVKKEDYILVDKAAQYVDVFHIDIAHADSIMSHNMLEYIVSNYPEKQIIFGNISTRDAAKRAIDNGADCIRVGIGGGCLVGDAMVLMANGSLKQIRDIVAGDFVINMHGKPVKVLKSWCTGVKNVVYLKTDKNGGYLKCTPDHKFYVRTKDGDIWKSIDSVKDGDFLLKPTSFNISPSINDFTIGLLTKDVKPGYELGYVLGAIFSSASVVCNDRFQYIQWFLNENKREFVEKLAISIKNITKRCVYISQKDDALKVVYKYNVFAKLMHDMIKYGYRGFFNKYFCNNNEYLKGICDGIDDFNEKEQSFDIINLYSVIKNVLDGKESGFVEQSITYYSHDLKESKVYDIEVDCPTHSFIANNIIVHNSVCATRTVTGHGSPTLQSVIDCSDIAYNNGVPIMADGGIQNSGDIIKLLAFGASTVSLGGLLASTSDSASEKIIGEDGKKYCIFRGMASKEAQELHKEGLKAGTAPEGIEKNIPYTGETKDVVESLLGGIRSGLTYSGAININELRQNSQYSILTTGAIKESKYL